jgi:hypothetical protein
MQYGMQHGYAAWTKSRDIEQDRQFVHVARTTSMENLYGYAAWRSRMDMYVIAWASSMDMQYDIQHGHGPLSRLSNKKYVLVMTTC